MSSAGVEGMYEELRERIEALRYQAAAGHLSTAVLFSDLANSTEYKSERELVSSLLKIYRHNAEVQEQIQRHGGQVIKCLGDGAMATFQVQEPDDIAMVVGAAVRIQRHFASFDEKIRESERIYSRIGITCGTVIDFSSVNPKGLQVCDPQGPVVDLAARLCSMAKPGQILCDASITTRLEHAANKFDISRGFRRSVKGFALPIEVFAVSWGEQADLTIDHPSPTFYPHGFLTTEFVLDRVRSSSVNSAATGHSNRHFCDNIELYNIISQKIRENEKYLFELLFLNPFSEFKSYSELITRRRVNDLRPDVLRNISAACSLFKDISANVRIVCSDYPMAIPFVRSDDAIFFALPLVSSLEQGKREGMVGGPYFRTFIDTELGKRILYTVEATRHIEIPIVDVAQKRINLEAHLATTT